MSFGIWQNAHQETCRKRNQDIGEDIIQRYGREKGHTIAHHKDF